MSEKIIHNLSRKQQWMISYDISDDRQRRKVHNLLKDHGHRVQFSVFECQLSKQQHILLREQLCLLIAETDSIRWYPLCHWCQSRLHWSGKGGPLHTEKFYIV